MNTSYVAGLFDGEGYVRIERQHFHYFDGRHHHIRNGRCRRKSCNGHWRYVLYIGINMTDPRAVRKIHARFGGYFKSPRKPVKKTHRPLHPWILSGPHALRFLRLVSPYLIVKKEEAAIGIEFQTHLAKRIKGGMRPRLDEAERAFRDRCIDELRWLKHVVHV